MKFPYFYNIFSEAILQAEGIALLSAGEMQNKAGKMQNIIFRLS